MNHRATVDLHFLELTVRPAASPVVLSARTARLDVDYSYTAADPDDADSVDQFKARAARLVDNLMLHSEDGTMVLLVRMGTDMLDKLTQRHFDLLEESLPTP